jgi:hypothetical protein
MSAITASLGGTPVSAIGHKLIRTTIPHVIASNHGGSGATQLTAANANTQKGLGRFSQLTPLSSSGFNQLAHLVKLRL